MSSEQIDPDLRRELVELEASIDAAYAAFRGELAGRRVSDNEITQVLIASDDTAERRAAWEASKQVGAAVAERIRRAARLRNRAAVALGYRGHFEMALRLSELDPDWLLATFDRLLAATDVPFAAWKAGLDTEVAARFGIGTGEIRPWHYADPFFQELPATAALDLDTFFAGKDVVALTTRSYDYNGLDIRPVLERSDLYSRDGKNQHAFCIDMDRSRDVRVLANIEANEREMETLLHEFGHAAYDLHAEPTLPFLLRRPAHMFTTEAVAMLFGRLTRDASWLRDVAGMDTAEAARIHRAAVASQRGGMLLLTRWANVVVRFEQALYADPDRGDLDSVWWDLVERYQGVTRPEGRSAPDWAAKIHVGTTPVYYQNYLLGELMASQVAAGLRAGTGAGLAANAAAGPWLRERVFSVGARWHWNTMIQRATGEPLDPGYFLREFVS